MATQNQFNINADQKYPSVFTEELITFLIALHKNFNHKRLELLKQRSTYNQISNYEIKAPINPLDSHDSARISFYYDSADSFEFALKPVYNDIYDISDGYLQGAYINFFDCSNFIVS